MPCRRCAFLAFVTAFTERTVADIQVIITLVLVTRFEDNGDEIAKEYGRGDPAGGSCEPSGEGA